jgi:benzoyl-CoA 2,3-dioxygenase component B
MVYLLHATSAATAAKKPSAAASALGRHGQSAHPRRLQRDDAGLARVLHVHVLHRPRRQVPAAALAESGFDPLARTTRFMLTEEAHHMFVGETGITRIPAAHVRAMNELHTDDPRGCVPQALSTCRRSSAISTSTSP